MNKKVLILAAVGAGAMLFLSMRNANAAAAQQYRVPGQTATGAPRYPTAPTIAAATEAAAYRDIGGLLGGIYSKVFKGGSASTSTVPSLPGLSISSLPDDSLAANPVSTVDPWQFEIATWTSNLPEYF